MAFTQLALSHDIGTLHKINVQQSKITRRTAQLVFHIEIDFFSFFFFFGRRRRYFSSLLLIRLVVAVAAIFAYRVYLQCFSCSFLFYAVVGILTVLYTAYNTLISAMCM